MAFVTLNKEKLAHNFRYLDRLFQQKGIFWGVVSKILCGNRAYLQEVLSLGPTQMLDTRISNLRMIKSLAPDIQTVYIKPPARRNIPGVVRYADVSFNTEISTIRGLGEEAGRQGKIHKVIIMIEMGDLREGVMGEHLIQFYAQVFECAHIEIIGIGTNLNCLNGVMPNQDKLIQLSLYKQLIETRFNCSIPWISGGTSVTLSLLLNHQVPPAINHFRIGEALFFGNDLFTGQTFPDMVSDVFRLYAEIIELREKPKVPIGEQGANVSGVTPEFDPSELGQTSFRAILDLGLLDIQPAYLSPEDDALQILEASSDMLVLDLGENPKGYKAGDLIAFRLRYMGLLALMNSRYIDKVVA
jgi:ornithine racemase